MKDEIDISYASFRYQKAFSDVFGLTLEQKGMYLEGLLAGCLGTDPEALDGPAKMGAIRGKDARDRAEAAVMQKKQAGQKSAESRKSRTGTAIPPGATNSPPNDVPNTVPNTVRDAVPNDVPNEHRTPFRTDAEQRSEQERKKEGILTPPYPPEGDGREVETGETERSVVAAWDAIAPRRGFPDAGPWTDRRRKALRALTPGVGFIEEWTKAVQAMTSDQWAKDRALPIDYLLRPENFARWRPMAPRSPEKESRTPIPASARPSDDPAEKAKREANRAALLQFSATKAPRAPDLHQ